MGSAPLNEEGDFLNLFVHPIHEPGLRHVVAESDRACLIGSAKIDLYRTFHSLKLSSDLRIALQMQ